MLDAKKEWIGGKVVSGDGRGHELGFPTANLVLDTIRDKPIDGIYACLARIENDPTILKAVLHVGPRPTFPESLPTIEVHLLEVDDVDLYGKRMEISHIKKIRDIVAFASTDDLISAIRDDIAEAYLLLEEAIKF